MYRYSLNGKVLFQTDDVTEYIKWLHSTFHDGLALRDLLQKATKDNVPYTLEMTNGG